MNRMRGALGALAGLLLPLALLFGPLEVVAHEEPEAGEPCAVCHAAQKTAVVPHAPDVSRPDPPMGIEAAFEALRTPVRRALRRPARAPPA